jgi:parallel beta-helix repeat protein
MGLGEMYQSGSIKRGFRFAALAALALGFAPGRASAQATTITSCQTAPLTTSVTLGQSIAAPTGWAGPCLTVGSDNVTINLATFTIDVSAAGDAGVAINAGAFNNTTINGNGTITTNYTTSAADASAAIEATGGSNLNVSGLTIENLPGGSPCAQINNSDQNYGTGISVNTVAGGTIGPDVVSCYQTGINVQNSSVPRQGAGSISGNTLNWNTYYMGGASSETYSGGLVLSNSSGWTVSNNQIEFTGSVSPSYDCTPTGTVLTCAFGLQIINGSSNNSITGNTVSSNFVGGIMTGSDTAKNSIMSNTALNNGLYDLYEVGQGHGNNFRSNTCNSVGGSLTLRACQ